MNELVTADQRPQVDEEDDWGKAIILAWENRTRRDLPEFFLRPLLQDLCDRIAIIDRNEPPALFSEKEWIGSILGAEPLDPKPFFLEYAYVKSDHWAYEKEWRVWTLEARVGQQLFTDYELLPEELEAVYLGCKMEAEQKAAITRVLTQKYPGTQIFQARRPVEEYRLYFDQL